MKAGLFNKVENIAARDMFIRNYVEDPYERKLKEEYGLEDGM